MKRVTITAGIGEDRDGNEIPGDKLAEALAIIRSTLAMTFGGFTEVEAVGGWVNDAGRVVMEPSRRWIALAYTGDAGAEVAELVRGWLNQASVVLEVEEVAGTFVEAPEAAGVTP